MPHLIIPMRDSGMMCCWNSTSNLVSHPTTPHLPKEYENTVQSRRPCHALLHHDPLLGGRTLPLEFKCQ
uniref:Uncharacterized protein n=1 Tax=Magallana gigas TaxID=29159 RepID=K1R5I5_MAGGI